MKKLIALTSLTTVAALSMSTLAFATSPQKPEDINTVTAVTPSIIVDQNTLDELVPIRTVAESNGFEVDWDNETKTTTLSKDDHSYTATLNSNVYNINGRDTILATPTQMIEGVTYVPTLFATLIEDDLDGAFDFSNPNIDSGYSVDTVDGENVGYTTLPAEIN